jgi:hypothetical protein
MTRRQEQLLLQKAVSTAFALGSLQSSSAAGASSTTVVLGDSGESSSDASSGEALVIPDGDVTDLSIASESDQSTGIYFPDGSGVAFVVNGEEIATITPSGMTVRGESSSGDEASESTPSELISNVLGATVTTSGAVWQDNEAIPFCVYPVSPDRTSGYFVYLSDNNVGISQSDKIYFFSLQGVPLGDPVSIKFCRPGLRQEVGPSYWDLLIIAESDSATFYVRRDGAATSAEVAGTAAPPSVSVTIVSELAGNVALGEPTILAAPDSNLGVESIQTVSSIRITSPNGAGYVSFQTKNNGESATGGSVPTTHQDRVQLSFPSASPARSNGDPENNSDPYQLTVQHYVNSGQERIYDVLWKPLEKVFTGASALSAGTSGLVPQPIVGDNSKYLRGDATWADVPTLPFEILDESINFPNDSYSYAQRRRAAVYLTVNAFSPTFVNLPRMAQAFSAHDDAQAGDEVEFIVLGALFSPLTFQQPTWTSFGYISATTTLLTTPTPGSYFFRLYNGVWALVKVNPHDHSELTLGNSSTTFPTSPTATSGTAFLPTNPLGFLNIMLNGSQVRVPYYAP